jgi:hypothetical protein
LSSEASAGRCLYLSPRNDAFLSPAPISTGPVAPTVGGKSGIRQLIRRLARRWTLNVTSASHRCSSAEVSSTRDHWSPCV